MGWLTNRMDLIGQPPKVATPRSASRGLLWDALRKQRLSGRKPPRRHSIGPSVLDLYCPSIRLAIELDGDVHDHEATEDYDRRREVELARHAIRVACAWSTTRSRRTSPASWRPSRRRAIVDSPPRAATPRCPSSSRALRFTHRRDDVPAPAIDRRMSASPPGAER